MPLEVAFSLSFCLVSFISVDLYVVKPRILNVLIHVYVCVICVLVFVVVVVMCLMIRYYI